jgi:hypothetical protein
LQDCSEEFDPRPAEWNFGPVRSTLYNLCHYDYCDFVSFADNLIFGLVVLE